MVMEAMSMVTKKNVNGTCRFKVPATILRCCEWLPG